MNCLWHKRVLYYVLLGGSGNFEKERECNKRGISHRERKEWYAMRNKLTVGGFFFFLRTRQWKFLNQLWLLVLCWSFLIWYVKTQRYCYTFPYYRLIMMANRDNISIFGLTKKKYAKYMLMWSGPRISHRYAMSTLAFMNWIYFWGFFFSQFLFEARNLHYRGKRNLNISSNGNYSIFELWLWSHDLSCSKPFSDLADWYQTTF